MLVLGIWIIKLSLLPELKSYIFEKNTILQVFKLFIVNKVIESFFIFPE